MAIKKVFEPLHAMLKQAAEEGKKVKDVLASATALMSAKAGGFGNGEKTFVMDENGVTHFVKCYYYKVWQPVSEAAAKAVGFGPIEYGNKAGSPTGLNNMCKQGVANWTKQNRARKAEEASLLNEVAAGTIKPTEIEDRRKAIAEAHTAIIPFEGGKAGVEKLPAEFEAMLAISRPKAKKVEEPAIA